MSKKRFEIEKEQLEKYFAMHMTYKEIADIYGCSHWTVMERAKEYGMKSDARKHQMKTDNPAAKEEVATEGHYTVSNVSGKTITDLYFYKTGSEEKGTNYAEGGLEKGATITVDITVDEAEAEGYAMTVEYVAEDGTSTVVFDNLHLEEANMYLKPAADVEGGATPFKPAE